LTPKGIEIRDIAGDKGEVMPLRARSDERFHGSDRTDAGPSARQDVTTSVGGFGID
jgi:hypothetical protein